MTLRKLENLSRGIEHARISRQNWFAILILILAPSLNALAQLGLSRTREYDADLNAARLTGDP